MRKRTASDVLRNQQPLEAAMSGELQGMVRGGDVFRDATSASAERQLDGDDLVDLLAMHHAVHWAMVNRAACDASSSRRSGRDRVLVAARRAAVV